MLVSHDRIEGSFEVLGRLNHGKMTGQETLVQYHGMPNIVRFENAIGAYAWKDLLENDSIQSQRHFIACAIQTFQQLGAINALVYCTGTLFANSMGFSKGFSALITGTLSI